MISESIWNDYGCLFEDIYKNVNNKRICTKMIDMKKDLILLSERLEFLSQKFQYKKYYSLDFCKSGILLFLYDLQGVCVLSCDPQFDCQVHDPEPCFKELFLEHCYPIDREEDKEIVKDWEEYKTLCVVSELKHKQFLSFYIPLCSCARNYSSTAIKEEQQQYTYLIKIYREFLNGEFITDSEKIMKHFKNYFKNFEL